MQTVSPSGPLYVHRLRFTRLTTVLAFVLACIFVLSGCTSSAEVVDKDKGIAAEQPNIIWLMSEDISTDLGCYGFPDVRTPNLDALAAQGVRFENAFVTNPICSPSRSAMMVGAHQVKTNTHHHRSNREVPLSAPYVPFTKLLRDVGYTTVLGHHGVRGKGRKTDVNFKHKPIGPWDGTTEFGLFDKFDTFTAADQPFFAQIQLNVTHRGDWWEEVSQQAADRHDPAEVTLPEYMADDPVVRKDWARYLDQLEYMDGEVAMIRQELEEKGLADNTIIIFIGDNGRCNIRGKGYLNDPGLHIPLIIYDPRSSGARAQVRSEVVSATDITASVLQYAGAELPAFLTGQPLQSEGFDREYVYAARDLWDEIDEKSRAIVSKDWKYIRNDMPDVPYDAHQAYLEFYRPAVQAMRKLNEAGKLTPVQALFFQPNKPAEEFYDLANDPDELNNLANQPEYAEQLDQFRRRAERYDREMAPVSDVYNPVHASAVDVLNHIKTKHPDLHQQMLDGEEIGYKKAANLYKEYKKKSDD
ncbi:sulfatase [Neolewinella aurantiaca]|uniref:Sulfatase n=1 Tax=Neolewinella aurantiaca TaxID=2602767 RepID=A0A5C7FCZ0_9BACT|nr:sulfatase [Neolewinella aurantiaca]TXF87966.1 sulfatase [Neolewinella aurantiaca]